MWKQIIQPRFSDTDALRHINNAAFLCWFEVSRTPIFRIFTPQLDVNKWQLIVARIEIDYLAPCFYGTDVEVQTSVSHIGNSSFKLSQKAMQNGVIVANGRVTMVRYNYKEEKSCSIELFQREQLEQHLEKSS